MSVTITCYGAANEIGGNKLLLEDEFQPDNARFWNRVWPAGDVLQ